MTKKTKKLKALKSNYNKYLKLLNKKDFNELDIISKYSIKGSALEKANELIIYIDNNFKIEAK